MKVDATALLRAAGVAVLLGAVWLLSANSSSHGGSETPSSDSACDVCQEVLIGSFSCAVQGGEVLAQVNFQGSGDLTPSATGAGMLVLGTVPGGTVSVCESLAALVDTELDGADCSASRVQSPVADQRVFDFACSGPRSILVRAMGEAAQRVISLAP